MVSGRPIVYSVRQPICGEIAMSVEMHWAELVTGLCVVEDNAMLVVASLTTFIHELTSEERA